MVSHPASSWRARPALLIGSIGVPLLVLLAVVSVPMIQRMRQVEANTMMAASPAPVDGDRAYSYLKQICELGPRPAGSDANLRQRDLVAAHFKKFGASVREQPFRARHPQTGEVLEMANLIGSWFPDRPRRVVIAAHYDTRPFPDEEFDVSRRKIPFIGANDGASGVALLMEIAHHLDADKIPWGVDLVLLDGEELVFGRNHPIDDYFLGSKQFARAYADRLERKQGRDRYVAGLILDMVGGKDLEIKQEPYSVRFAPGLVREVWAVARSIKAESFRNRLGREVLDDHLAFNDAGIPTIDIIDFDYPFWHKADDVPENCSAASLAEVGRVVTAWLAQPPSPSRSRSR
jgi:Zn-dependent M28 family amino/carboxypeptidase